MSSYANTQQLAKQAKAKADELFAHAHATFADLARQKAATSRQIAKYTALLASLTARQRALLARQARAAQLAVAVARSRAATGTTNTATGTQQPVTAQRTSAQRTSAQGTSAQGSSAIVSKAIAFALAQVGKPYVWGAAGPGSYDCSGLTMASYRHAGINLPHSAASQYNYGHHIGYADMQPGDLMFFYQPIGHVSIYIGNGLMVSAPQTGEDVTVIPANSYISDFTGATRLVG